MQRQHEQQHEQQYEQRQHLEHRRAVRPRQQRQVAHLISLGINSRD